MENTAAAEETIKARAARFEAKIVAHPILASVFNDVRAVTRHPAGISLLLVVGPTGAGKTTLVTRLERELREEATAAMREDPGMIAVVKVEAPSPDNGTFHWGDFYVRFLEAVNEPMIKHKSLDTFEKKFRQRRKLTGTFSELRRAVENCIRHRGTKMIVVDEAQHLTKVPNERRLLDQMDTIKSLASLSGVLFILVGTYELLLLLNRSGQLARRTRCIHFPRYRLDRPEDQRVLRNVIATLQDAMPFARSVDLQQHFEYLYMRSLGCIGILKDWLKRAVVHALEREEDSLELSDLEATAHGNDSILQILGEIKKGEKDLEHNAGRGEELRRALGLDVKPLPAVEETSREHSQRRGIAERKPVRDPVGVGI